MLTAGTADEQVSVVSRFPGACGNGQVIAREAVAPASATTMASSPIGTLLRTGPLATPAHHVKLADGWHPADNLAAAVVSVATLTAAGADPRILTLSLLTIDGDGQTQGAEGLGFDRLHPRWVGHVFAANPSRRSDQLQNLFAFNIGGGVSAIELRDGLFSGATANTQGELERTFTLSGGLDGAEPSAANYALALGEIASLEDVSIVAAPAARPTRSRRRSTAC